MASGLKKVGFADEVILIDDIIVIFIDSEVSLKKKHIQL